MTSAYFAVGHRSLISQAGLLGMAPADAQIDDTIHNLFGGNMPFILRDVKWRQGCYTYVWEAYVHGNMDGEVVKAGMKAERVILV